MIGHRLTLMAAPLLLIGCVSTPAQPSDELSRARLGETVYVDGPRITPLAVLEDSRCPRDVECVWAGRVRITARIGLGSGSQVRELTLGQPQKVADGSLELVDVVPERVAGEAIDPKSYRFAFRFMGGL